jgi:hypothetical protein
VTSQLYVSLDAHEQRLEKMSRHRGLQQDPVGDTSSVTPMADGSLSQRAFLKRAHDEGYDSDKTVGSHLLTYTASTTLISRTKDISESPAAEGDGRGSYYHLRGLRNLPCPVKKAGVRRPGTESSLSVNASARVKGRVKCRVRAGKYRVRKCSRDEYLFE